MTEIAGALRVLVFDFDGVIIESNDAKTAGFAEVFSAFPAHFDTMMAYHHGHVSASRFEKFDHLLHVLGRSGDRALRDELARKFSAIVREQLVRVPFVPGAIETLQEFSGWMPMYLASVTPADDLEATLASRHLRHFFRDVYGCPPWTKPSALRDVLDREGCAPEAAVLVGDSLGDFRATVETGVRFVARDSGLPLGEYPGPCYPDLNAIRDVLRPKTT